MAASEGPGKQGRSLTYPVSLTRAHVLRPQSHLYFGGCAPSARGVQREGPVIVPLILGEGDPEYLWQRPSQPSLAPLLVWWSVSESDSSFY